MKEVSVIIVAYNSVSVLADTIDSVLAQSHPPQEIIVVDDGSSDASSEVAKVYEEVTLLRQKHMGRYAALNNGVMMASTPWITFLEASEQWPKRRLQKQMKWLEEHDEIACVCIQDEVVSLAKALPSGSVTLSDVMMERKRYHQLGGFDESDEENVADAFWMQVISS